MFVGAPSKTEGNQIFTLRADGSGLQQRTDSSTPNVGPDWSPDGSTIAYASLRGLRPTGLNSNIALVAGAGPSIPRMLTRARGYEANPAWSPDGKRIAFAGDIGGRLDIWVMDADGSNLVALTHDEAIDQDPAWSPDGERIVFSSARDDNYEIYVMDSDGSHLQRLTANQAGVPDQFPAWSPDGSSIAFSRGETGAALDVFVMAHDGSKQHRLTDAPGIDAGPAWSPDGSQVAFSSDRSGRLQIWVMDADGSDPYQLSHTDGYAFGPDWTKAST